MGRLVSRLRRAGGLREITVSAVARDLGTTTRTLERLSVGTALAPRELRDWVILLFVCYTRAESISLAAAAQRLGVDAQRLYRIRSRLIGERVPGLSARAQFAVTYQAFVERCRVLRF